MSNSDPSAVAEIEPRSSERPARADWAFIRQVVWKQRKNLFIAQVAAVLVTLAEVPQPLLFPVLVDELLLGKAGPVLPLMSTVFPDAWLGPVFYVSMILAVALLLRLFALALGVLQAKQFATMARNVIYRLRCSLLWKLERLSLAEYETRGGGAVASRLVTDINTVDDFVSVTLGRFVVALLTLAGITAVLLWIHWKLALFILLLNPVVIYFTTLLGRFIMTLKSRENSAVESFQQALTETLDTIYQIRASNRDRYFFDRLIGHARSVREHSVAYSWKSNAVNRVSFLIYLFGFDVFRAASMLAVLFSGLSIGQMFAVYSYLWFMMIPSQELLNMRFAYFAANGALGRIQQLIALQEEPRITRCEDPFVDTHTVGIRVENLHFTYGQGPEILKGIALDIAPAEKVALVGASGSGKSTLVHALLGLYPAAGGTICFGGVPVTRIGWERVREKVAVVLQQPALFNDTIRFNLTLGSERSSEELWQALEIAQLADHVAGLDDGLETVVGRAGVRLSGGQRQRLAVARMILSAPQVVILDEATSALDLETEARLYAALLRHLEGKTLVVIAHRLSALRLVDRTLVFEDGKISEQGRHEELMTKNGPYARLYSDQQRIGAGGTVR